MFSTDVKCRSDNHQLQGDINCITIIRIRPLLDDGQYSRGIGQRSDKPIGYSFHTCGICAPGEVALAYTAAALQPNLWRSSLFFASNKIASANSAVSLPLTSNPVSRCPNSGNPGRQRQPHRSEHRPVAERLWHPSRGPGQLERPGGRGRRDRPAGQAEQHRRRDPRPQPRRRRQRPPVQQRRRERAGRQPQPHRPEHRPGGRRRLLAVRVWRQPDPGRRSVECESAGYVCPRSRSTASSIEHRDVDQRRRRLRLRLRALAQGPLIGVGRRPPVQQRRCECAGRQHQPHRPEHRPGGRRRLLAVRVWRQPDPGRRSVELRVSRVRLPSVSQHSFIHRTPRRRPTSATATAAAASPRARPPHRGRATSTSPTASMRMRWPATSTSPARTSTRRPAATTRGAGVAAARSRSQVSRTRVSRVRSPSVSQHSFIHRTPRRRPTSATATAAAASPRARPPHRGRQRPPVQQRRCKRARAESERHQAVHRSDRCRRCDPGRRAARGEPPGGGSTRCGTPVRSGQQSDVAQRAMVRSPMSCGRTIATLCRLTRRPSVPIVKAQERMGSGMDPRSKWVLRPAGVCVVGTLMILCGLAAAGGALAAPGQSILRPDAPPSGAVVSPAPDQPAPTSASADVVRAPAAAPRQAVAPAEPSRPVARPHEQPRRAAATKPTVRSSPPPHAAAKSDTVVLPRQGRLPDSVRAFLATPITRISDGGPDRAITALAGAFLAMVALGAGCLTVAVNRVARER